MGGHHTPAALCPERDLVPTVLKAGWTLELVWTAWKKYCLHWGLIPDRAAHSELLYRHCYPAHPFKGAVNLKPLCAEQYIEFKPLCQ
jgi:hypothetical protein